jgi:adenylate kinase
MTKVVVASGIPGCDKVGLYRYVASQTTKPVKFARVFDYMRQAALEEGQTIDQETVLNLYPVDITRYRKKAIEMIQNYIQDEKPDILILATPTIFRWRGQMIEGLDFEDTASLSPSSFITVLDALPVIQWRLRNDPQWQHVTFTLEELAIWRQVEEWYTSVLARARRAPHHIVARSRPKNFAELILNENKRKVYLSYPMTVFESRPNIGSQGALRRPRDREDERSAIIRRLESAGFIVFDPAGIKDLEYHKAQPQEMPRQQESTEAPGSSQQKILLTIPYDTEEQRQLIKLEISEAELETVRKHIDAQTVSRDFKFIDQSDYVVVFYHQEVPSFGVVCEIMYGSMRGKKVFVYYPFKASPFLRHLATLVTDSTDELMKALEALS